MRGWPAYFRSACEDQEEDAQHYELRRIAWSEAEEGDGAGEDASTKDIYVFVNAHTQANRSACL